MIGGAADHKPLVNNKVHIFVDDQNLFYGITNGDFGPDFRIDFGALTLFTARDEHNKPRPVDTAFMAGVIPDDDTFWDAAAAQGWDIERGYHGAGGKSKQDDNFVVAELVEVLLTKEGPSTIVLVAGDGDYGPALKKAEKYGWRVEIAFIKQGRSKALDPYVHLWRTLNPLDIQRNPEWRK